MFRGLAIIAIVCNESLRDKARAEAASTLSRSQLTDEEIALLRTQFIKLLETPATDSALMLSLAETLCAVRPQCALDLLGEAEARPSELSTATQSAILKFTQRNGYLLLDNQVIGPDGLVVA